MPAVLGKRRLGEGEEEAEGREENQRHFTNCWLSNSVDSLSFIQERSR